MTTLTDWRGCRCTLCALLCCAAFLAGSTVICSTFTAFAQDAPAQEVDAPTKKLMAANGLFQRGLFKLASQEYAEFVAQNPQHAQITPARYALAVCHYRLSEFDKAVALLTQVVEDTRFEQSDEALAVLGHCQLSLKQYEKAVGAFDDLLRRFPQSKHAEMASLSRAQAYYLGGKSKEACDACEKFLAAYPQSPERGAGFYFLALSRRALGQNEQAVAALEQMNKEAPNARYQTDAALLMGQALESLNKLDAAIEQYRRMLAIAPETRKADARYSLGIALYKAAKYDESAKELTTLLADGGGAYAQPAKLQLGLVQLAGGKINDARATLDAVAREDASRAIDARYGLAQCDIAQKKFDSARVTLDALTRANPPPANLAQIFLDRAVCLIELGRFEEAAAELESFIAKYAGTPQYAEALYRRAFCLHRLTKYDQSHALCQQVAALPAGEMTQPAAELDAEDLFLLARYPDAAKAFETLSAAAKDDAHRSRWRLRLGQCAYFAADYPKAAEILSSLASDPKTAQTEELQVGIFLLGDALLQQGKNAEAAAALGKYAALAKADKHEALFKLGLAQLRTNDAASAARALTEASAGPNDSPWVQRALLELGQIHYKAQQPQLASAALNRLLSANSPAETAAPAVYLLAWIDFDAKRFVEAASRWKTVVEKYGAHALAVDAAFQRGVALKEAKQYDEALGALQTFAAAHADSPNVAKARQLAAACLTALGRNDQAAAMLASLAGGPGAPDTVLYDLAWSRRATKDDAGAQDAYRRLIHEHPDSKLLSASRAELAELLYSQKKYDDAASLLEPVLADKSADPKVKAAAAYRLGWCYQKLGKNDKAAEVFAAFPAAAGGPDDEMAASAALQAGLAFAQEAKFDKAERALADAIARYPKHADIPVAMLKLGEVQAELTQYEASARTYQQFLEKYPRDKFAYRAHFGIGWSLENRKKYDEARAEYQNVIAANNGETAARAQFQIGETYLGESKFEQAIAALLAVEDVYAYPKWSARALLEAGRAFEQLKQPEQARQQYTQLVNKYKDAPEADMARERLKSTKG